VGKREGPAGRMCECGRARLGSRRGYSSLLSARYRRQAHCPMRFLFPIFKICAMLLSFPQNAASAAGSEAGMDCGTALAEQARLNRHGEVLRGASSNVQARWRRPPRGESERFTRKPLNSLDSRKKEAWISLPLALNFLPSDLDFPSPGFANPSANFVKYSRFTWNCPAASRVHRAPRGRRGALLREGSARRFKMCECGRASGQRPAKVLDAA